MVSYESGRNHLQEHDNLLKRKMISPKDFSRRGENTNRSIQIIFER